MAKFAEATHPARLEPQSEARILQDLSHPIGHGAETENMSPVAPRPFTVDELLEAVYALRNKKKKKPCSSPVAT